MITLTSKPSGYAIAKGALAWVASTLTFNGAYRVLRRFIGSQYKIVDIAYVILSAYLANKFAEVIASMVKGDFDEALAAIVKVIEDNAKN